MRTHTAFLVDGLLKDVLEIEVDETLRLYYDYLSTDIVEIGGHLPNGDEIIVDENGLLTLGDPKEASWFIVHGGNTQPLVKAAIIVGQKEDGDGNNIWTDPKSTLREIRARVEWITPKEAQAYFSNPPPLPKGYIDCRFNPFER